MGFGTYTIDELVEGDYRGRKDLTNIIERQGNIKSNDLNFIDLTQREKGYVLSKVLDGQYKKNVNKLLQNNKSVETYQYFALNLYTMVLKDFLLQTNVASTELVYKFTDATLENIINIVGEKILRRDMQNKLSEYKNRFIDDKNKYLLEQLKKEKEELERKIEGIENDKN